MDVYRNAKFLAAVARLFHICEVRADIDPAYLVREVETRLATLEGREPVDHDIQGDPYTVATQAETVLRRLSFERASVQWNRSNPVTYLAERLYQAQAAAQAAPTAPTAR